MRILLINQYFYPDVAPTGHLLTELAKDLAAMGEEVIVVTGRPGYTEETRTAAPSLETFKDGIEVHRLASGVFSRRSMLGRIFNYLSFLLLALRKVLILPRADVALIMSTPPLVYLLGIPLKYLYKTRIVHSAQDVYPDLAVALGVMKSAEDGNLAMKVIERVSRWGYGATDAIVTLSEDMRRHFIQKGIPEGKLSVIENWVSREEIYPIQHQENWFRQQQEVSDKFVVVYSGNLGMGHDIEAIKSALFLLKDHREIVWFFIGGGMKREPLEQFVHQNHLDNVRFLPYQPRKILPYTFGMADVSLFSMREEALGLLLPVKFYSILASGRPTIAICPPGSDVTRVLQESGCGLPVNVGDGDGLADAVLKLYHDADLREEMGQIAYQLFLSRYERRISTAKYHQLMKNVKRFTQIR